MPNPALDVFDDLSGHFLEPASVERFGGDPELDEVVRVIWGLHFAPFLLP
jgi:hypothetical protein